MKCVVFGTLKQALVKAGASRQTLFLRLRSAEKAAARVLRGGEIQGADALALLAIV